MLVFVVVARVHHGRSTAGTLLFSALVAAGCATTTTTPLAAPGARPTYQIECMHVDECWTAARRACKGRYQTVEKHQNWISESDLPGLNERTAQHAHPRWSLDERGGRPFEPYGPDFDSNEPLPITDVVVACTDG